MPQVNNLNIDYLPNLCKNNNFHHFISSDFTNRPMPHVPNVTIISSTFAVEFELERTSLVMNI